MKVALFGAGRIGKVHAASIKMDPRSELVAVTDVMADAAEALAQEHDIAVRTPEEIFADASIDAILIASSTNTHSDLIEAGVKAGKAILCEKPLDLSLERALQVRQIAASHEGPAQGDAPHPGHPGHPVCGPGSGGCGDRGYPLRDRAGQAGH